MEIGVYEAEAAQTFVGFPCVLAEIHSSAADIDVYSLAEMDVYAAETAECSVYFPCISAEKVEIDRFSAVAFCAFYDGALKRFPCSAEMVDDLCLWLETYLSDAYFSRVVA